MPTDQLAEEVPQLAQHRVRLIYFGRVLSDGVRLAEWLESLEAKQGAEYEDLAVDAVRVGAHWISPTEFVLREQRGDALGNEAHVVDATRLPVVHLQCSVGPLEEEGVEERELEPETRPVQGFDRLQQSAGLEASDVERMRAEFRSSMGIFSQSGDVLRAQDEEDHARALEEQWIDNGAEAMAAPRWTVDAVFGLLIGFFFPLLPLLFVSDGFVPRRPAPRPRESDLERTVTQLTQVLEERDAARARQDNPPDTTQQTRQLLEQLAEQLASRTEQNTQDSDAEEGASLSEHAMYMRTRSVVFSPFTRATIFSATLFNLVFGISACLAV